MNQLAELPNPFRENVVQDAWQATVDIAEIHAEAFEACKAGVASAARGVPDSLLIYGAAGSGKTHLLARLQRHLVETRSSAPDHMLHCIFCFVRLQTSPQLLWQHLRRRLATDLMRREQGLTQLQRLIAHQLGRIDGRSARAGILELSVLRSQDQGALAQHFQKLATKLALPRNLCVALEHLVVDRNVRDASAWLAGDSLPESVMSELGFGADLDEDREEASRHLVTALCRLAGETLPMTFCFDQVESLQRSAADDEALFRFARLAADLYDADPNVFVITCLQSAFLDQLKRAAREADFDRMARRSTALNPLSAVQVEKLLASRLDALPQLVALRPQSSDTLFPLERARVREIAAASPCVPRRVLALAARAFEERQEHKVVPPPSTEQFLAEELAERTAESIGSLTVGDTPNVVVRGVQILAAIKGWEFTDADPQGADVVVTGTQKTAISVRNEADGRSLTPRLKALLANVPRKDGAKVTLIRDARLPISPTAVKAREHIKTLQERGCSLIEPRIEALAALDALASLLGDAKSGDLANQANALDGGAVLNWLKTIANDLAFEPVKELSDALFVNEPVLVDTLQQDLADLLATGRVLELESTAALLKQPVERVLSIARAEQSQCLVLDGPPTLILDMAGVAPEMEVRP